MSLLSNVMKMFRELWIDDIQTNESHCTKLLNQSLGLVTALSLYLGYKVSTTIAKCVLESNESVIDIIKKIFY